MAATLAPEDEALVVSQSLLPHLQQLGALGGRQVQVLMQRLPLFELQARLDEAHARWPDSPTLGDFRADPRLVEAEALALDDAEEIITPHAMIAACFPGKARLLDWQLPSLAPAASSPRASSGGPLRIQLPASTVGRKGAWALREALCALVRTGIEVELFVAGRELEGSGFWSRAPRGLRVHSGVGRASSVDVVVLPAWVEHQPRALLRALAQGVPVIATPACGIPSRAGLQLVDPGSAEALDQALRAHVEPAAATRRGA